MFFAKFFALVLATTVIALPSDLESRAVTATPETHEVIGYRAVSEVLRALLPCLPPPQKAPRANLPLPTRGEPAVASILITIPLT